MKKIIIISLSLILILNSGCATVFGGRISECQKHSPLPDEPNRSIRAVPLIFDILFFPIGLIGLAIDFSNGGMYQPCKLKN